MVGPDLFIPVAEETGLIGDMFESVCRQALQEARHWDPSLILSVNVSPGQLKDPWLSHRIIKILTEVSFPPERLEVEITESSLFENLAVAQAIVTSLKNQGVRLVLDDFGTAIRRWRICARFRSTGSRSTAASYRRCRRIRRASPSSPRSPR